MSKHHVLIVDEDRNQAEIHARILQTEGYGVHVADSGREAVDVVRGHVPDLVLTDVRMPGADGAWLFAEVREGWPELPVFVLAEDRVVNAALDAVRRGAADFAVKPVLPGELVLRCAGVLRERALRREIAELRERLGDGAGDDQRLVARLMASEISFEEFERAILVRALGRTRGNQSRAARLLGMTRRTLQYRIEKFDIDTAAMRA